MSTTGLTGSISEISMGLWVKLSGGYSPNQGIIHYGSTDTDDHLYIRARDYAYSFQIGKDISGSDTWSPSLYNGSNMHTYITSVSGHASKFWYYVIRVNSSGLVTTSLNKSTFETSVTSNVNMSGASAGTFGLFGDPYTSVNANHTVGVCWWYNGVISQADSDSVYDRYATRFGY